MNFMIDITKVDRRNINIDDIQPNNRDNNNRRNSDVSGHIKNDTNEFK